VHETLPNVDVVFPGLPRDRSIRVYSDVDQVSQHLTDPRFELVESMDDADVLWTKHYLKDFRLDNLLILSFSLMLYNKLPRSYHFLSIFYSVSK